MPQVTCVSRVLWLPPVLRLRPVLWLPPRLWALPVLWALPCPFLAGPGPEPPARRPLPPRREMCRGSIGERARHSRRLSTPRRSPPTRRSWLLGVRTALRRRKERRHRRERVASACAPCRGPKLARRRCAARPPGSRLLGAVRSRWRTPTKQARPAATAFPPAIPLPAPSPVSARPRRRPLVLRPVEHPRPQRRRPRPVAHPRLHRRTRRPLEGPRPQWGRPRPVARPGCLAPRPVAHVPLRWGRLRPPRRRLLLLPLRLPGPVRRCLAGLRRA